MAVLNRKTEFQRAVRCLQRGGAQAEAAFSRLFRSYAGPLRAYARLRVGDEAEADDVVQEVFLRFLRSIRGGRSIRYSSYLWSVTDAVLTDRRRTREAASRDERRTLQYDDELATDQVGQSDAYEQSEVLDCLERSLTEYARIFPQHARAVELAVIEEWSVPEMATYLDRTIAATRQYLYECRKKLRKIVMERCGDLV
jgi:RNA polymerase sigma-70 factor (ECF subfamily)